jgi:hypothetical protein
MYVTKRFYIKASFFILQRISLAIQKSNALGCLNCYLDNVRESFPPNARLYFCQIEAPLERRVQALSIRCAWTGSFADFVLALASVSGAPSPI